MTRKLLQLSDTTWSVESKQYSDQFSETQQLENYLAVENI